MSQGKHATPSFVANTAIAGLQMDSHILNPPVPQGQKVEEEERRKRIVFHKGKGSILRPQSEQSVPLYRHSIGRPPPLNASGTHLHPDAHPSGPGGHEADLMDMHSLHSLGSVPSKDNLAHSSIEANDGPPASQTPYDALHVRSTAKLDNPDTDLSGVHSHMQSYIHGASIDGASAEGSGHTPRNWDQDLGIPGDSD